LSEGAKLSETAKTNAATVRVALPYHLRNLACVEGDALLQVNAPVTLRAVLDALETRYPMLRGTIREYETGQRRAFLRFFACEEDWSLESPDKSLPEAVATGKEPLLILGAIAGG
jgi:sulfur-carrier protein